MEEAPILNQNNQPVGEPVQHPAENTESLLTVDELALYLRLEPQTIRTLAREGKIPALKVGRIWRFRRSEVLRALKKAQEQAVKDDKNLVQTKPGI